MENLGIKFILSAPYYPQNNGCYEAIHKEIKKYLLDEYNKNKENFDIGLSIENAIEYHNNRLLKSIGFKQSKHLF